MENHSAYPTTPVATDFQFPQIVSGGKRASYYLVISLVVFTTWWFQTRKQPTKLDFPFYKASKTKWIFDAETLIRDSYAKFRDCVYQIKATEGVQVLVPARLIGELKGLPEDVLSAAAAVSESLQSKYTKFTPGHNGDLLAILVRTKLTQNLNRVIPQLRQELESMIATEFPNCDEWASVKWQPFSIRAIARLSGYAFVGPSISRQERWTDVSTNFAVHIFTACVKLQMFPDWARPIGQYFVSELKSIRQDIEVAKEIIGPVFEERLQYLENPHSGDAPNDMIQWLMDSLRDEDKCDLTTQAELQLILAAAAIHTTNNLICECIYDLATHPEFQEELREEAYQALEVGNGWAKKETMASLKKMDSFMREVQRLRGNITSFVRKVMKPISLSDGTHLPAGTKVLTPQAGIARDERYFPDPERLDALRFYHMRQESDEANNRWQFTSLSDTYTNFGAGKHACPGRFFAGNVIKTILAHLVINYEIRLKEGHERPKAMSVVMTKAPCPNTELEFRRRSLLTS